MVSSNMGAASYDTDACRVYAKCERVSATICSQCRGSRRNIRERLYFCLVFVTAGTLCDTSDGSKRVTRRKENWMHFTMKVDSRIGIVARMHAISTWLRLFRLSSAPGPCSVHERWGASRNYYCHRAVRSLGTVADLTSEQQDISIIHEGIRA
jgi:hypothetical protein